VLENCNWRRVCSPPLFYKMTQYAPEWWPTIRQNAGPVWSRIVTTEIFALQDGTCPPGKSGWC